MKRIDGPNVGLVIVGVLLIVGAALEVASTPDGETSGSGATIGFLLGAFLIGLAIYNHNRQAEHERDTSAAAGWKPDPTGRFERRFWDGQQWTEHVQSAGQPATDPI